MVGRHVAPGTTFQGEALVSCHDVCPCGRRDPGTLSPSELASDAKAYRRLQREAARLRLVTDRRLERGPAPEWVVALADEQADPILGPGWVEEAIDRLELVARANCSCQCHGRKTRQEMSDGAM